MILADTSGLLAAFGHDSRPYQQARAAYENDRGPVIMSPYVLAELDYMLLRRAGLKAETELLREVAAGIFKLAEFDSRDIAQAADVVEQYSGLRIGLADASIVVLAARYGTTRVLTLDERHFRAMRPLHADAFTILPADA